MSIAQRKTGQVHAIRMVDGGDSYSSTPTVSFSGGGGSGAAGVVCMTGEHVERVIITDGGSGYTSAPTITFSHGNASAVAYAHTDPLRPITFFRSRFNDVYGVDGMGRGLRWNGRTANMEPIGLVKPAIKPTITKSSTNNQKRLAGIQIENRGTGYTDVPTVTISGGSPTTNAAASARIAEGAVQKIILDERGEGFTSTPSVTISGGQGGGCVLAVVVDGKVSSVTVDEQGSNYTSAPTVTFSGLGAVNAEGTAVVEGGKVTRVDLLTSGTGATGAITVAFSGGGGTGASATVNAIYKVTSVTVSNGGAGYFTNPQVQFNAHVDDVTPVNAEADAAADSAGTITGITVTNAGEYTQPPTAEIVGVQATASAIMAPLFVGKYRCFFRYIDGTDPTERGPIPSSVGEMTEVDCGSGCDGLTWSLSHNTAALDDRVAGLQLWRTTSNQSVILFKVAEIARTDAAFNGTYLDQIGDGELKDTKRPNFGIMPMNMPGGQVNARRFNPPPGNFAVGVMFQDRAWYAVDTTGYVPNTLVFSEVDEPESVPGPNSLVVQESITDSDKIVGLIPLSSVLIAAQERHLYVIQYVAQPVIDASVMLGCYRGMLNSRCYGILNGVAYIADSAGLYGFDGTNEEPVSVAVDDYWRKDKIDFSKSDKFFIKTDTNTRTVRFFYCNSTDTYPTRSLCYCVATKAWWEEEYGEIVSAGTNTTEGGKLKNIYGGQAGRMNEPVGYSDNGTDISYSIKTGNLPLVDADNGSRRIGIMYDPTVTSSDMNVKLHYNNSTTSRSNAIQTNPGSGFRAGPDGAVLDMKKTRSALGEATGEAKANYSGRVDDKSAGADKHIAVSFSGTQSTADNAPKIFSVSIEGVK